MYVRCRACHEAVWIAIEENSGQTHAATCRSCGQRHILTLPKIVLTRREQLFAEARKYAAANGIDLPSAYSVLHGVLDLDQVRDFQRPAPAASTADDADAQEDRRFKYDPAFQAAVDEGFLTPTQATQKGKREVQAVLLASRHQLPIGVARDVVDNRVSLVEAIRGRKAAQSTPVHLAEQQRTHSPQYLVWTVVLLLAVTVVALAWQFKPPAPGEGSVAQVGAAQVQRDGLGQLVQIAGPDPASVLDAYCEAAAVNHNLEPVGLMASAHPAPRVRVGLLRKRSNPQNLLAISIRLDRVSERWTAGDGSAPLVAILAPLGAVETYAKQSEQ